ncbi:hypothetical protein B0H11DRAFT_1324333 [Mycena galericulata]|nr:hypothetical protein B0H11DRAFT_1324333 [Mycena galericulata]
MQLTLCHRAPPCLLAFAIQFPQAPSFPPSADFASPHDMCHGRCKPPSPGGLQCHIRRSAADLRQSRLFSPACRGVGN